MRRAIACSLFLFVALAAGCSGSASTDQPDRSLAELTIGTAELHVEVAATPQARARGLMGRTQLPPGHGMAFVFDQATTDRFWMKDTLIPLSIAFWDGDNRVMAILDMQPCPADPCPTYGPDRPYVGAVEVNLGYFDDHGIQVGDHVELTQRAPQ